MKYWEIIADNLSKSGFSLGWVSAVDIEGRTIWECGRAWLRKAFYRARDGILTAFVELQRAIHEFAVDLIS